MTAKMKKNMYWVAIGAVVLFYILFVFMGIFPISSEIDSKKDELDTLVRGLRKYNDQDKSKPIETEERVKAHEKNLEKVKKEYERVLKDFFQKKDQDFLDRWFDGKKVPLTQFLARYQTEYGNLMSTLSSKLLLEEDEHGNTPEGLQNDEGKINSEETMHAYMKYFNIQKAIVDILAPDKNPLKVSRLSRIVVGTPAWGMLGTQFASALPRAVGQDPDAPPKAGKQKPLDAYFTTIRVGIELDMCFTDVPKLLERIDKSPILFKFHAVNVAKTAIRPVTIEQGKIWDLRRGRANVKSQPLLRPLSYGGGGLKTLPAIIPVESNKEANFGVFTAKQKKEIPHTREMISEPPVRVIFLYEVLDFK